ncbi:MAG: hypothetical protein H0U49_00765 [Parachlamydiaceae bacterium]|nr:hypothetical protein [Parachlamydiaceae bacterium]
MENKGIRILDQKNRIVSVELGDILKNISNGDSFFWSILFFNGNIKEESGKSTLIFKKEINNSERGLLIKWSDLNILSMSLREVEDIVIIGCKNSGVIQRYEDDQVMFETCDFVIIMFDSCFWEVFSFDVEFLERLANKFKQIEMLKTDFLK